MAKSYLDSLLGERERIVLVARQHWFILFSSIFLELALILVFLAATVSAAIFFPPYALIIVAIGFALLLLPIATMTRDILNYTNRQYIVTNRRVMQISGVFNKNAQDSSLEKVNDVVMKQSAWGRMFDYGDIEILTASELGVNLLKQIEDPIHFKTAMLNAKEHLDRGDEQPGGEGIPALIIQLEELRRQGVLSDEEFQSKKAQLLAKL
ncbi:MAG: PH domain-containing protein [Anaerolineales bacterium]|nr:PH domain-containing protein [Anaerolineales bacterium]